VDRGRGRTYGGGVSSPGERRPDDGGAPYPNPYTDRPPAGAPGSPYDPQPGSSADAPPYVYNPYGNYSYPSSYPVPPAGLGSDDAAVPVRRPGSLHLALVLLLVAAVPYLLSGLLMVVGAGEVEAALPEAQLQQLRDLGVDIEQVVRTAGVLMLGVAAVFVLLAVLAWTGRRVARGLLAALTAGFVLMVLVVVLGASAQGTAVDAGSLLVVGGPAVLAVIGVVLMFRPAARAWFDRRR
jgi:hypothetical protein